jgi:hypothetical protein
MIAALGRQRQEHGLRLTWGKKYETLSEKKLKQNGHGM